jgi:hypothetical protein
MLWLATHAMNSGNLAFAHALDSDDMKLADIGQWPLATNLQHDMQCHVICMHLPFSQWVLGLHGVWNPPLCQWE